MKSLLFIYYRIIIFIGPNVYKRIYKNSIYTLSNWHTMTLSVSNKSPLSPSLTSSPEFNGSYKIK